MASKSLTGILVVCLLANLCNAWVFGGTSRSSDDSSRSSDDSSRSSDDSSRSNGHSRKDKCPHLWKEYEDNCFRMYAVRATREDAKIECEDRQDGTLVNIRTSRDNDFIEKYWDDISPDTDKIWIGLKRDSDDRDEFIWDNDDEIQFTNWIHYEPNDDNEREDCVVFIRDEGWNDQDCHGEKYPFICMKPRD